MRGLTLRQTRALLTAAERQARADARLALYVARAARLDRDGYRQAWEALG